MRAELDEQRIAVLDERSQCGPQAHGPRRVGLPVAAVARRHRAAGHRREQRQRRLAELQAVELGAQGRRRASDGPAVKRVAARKPDGAHAARVERPGERIQGAVAPARHAGARAVVGRQRRVAAELFEQGLEVGCGQRHGDHGALVADCLEQPAAAHDEVDGGGEREGARHVRRRDLAHAVPDHRRGRDAKRREQPCSPTCTAKTSGCATSVRSRRPGSERSSSTIDQPHSGAASASQASTASRKTGSRSSRSAPMPGHWAPWPEKTKTTWSGPSSLAGSAIERNPAASSAPFAPATAARMSWCSRRTAAAPATSAASPGAASSCAASRDARVASPSDVRALTGSTRTGRAGGSARGSAGGASTIACAFVPLRPNALTAARSGRSDVLSRSCPAGAEDRERPIERHALGRRLEARLRRDAARAHDEHRLQEADDAGGRVEVAEVRLVRADRQRRAAARVQLPQRGELDRIAKRRAGRMGLRDVDVSGDDPGGAQRGLAEPHLGLGARDRQTRAVAVVSERRAADHRMDAITSFDRVVEALEHDERAALAAQDAVRGGVERAAAAARRQRADAVHEEAQLGGEEEVHAAREGSVDLTGAQRRACEVDRDERGRAGARERQRRPVKIEEVRQPAAAERQLLAGRVVRVDRFEAARSRMQQPVVGREHAGEDTGRAARPVGQRRARVVEGLRADLEQEPLLRVELAGLAWRDAKRLRIEPVDVVEERADRRPRPQLVPIPARGGDRPERRVAGGQQSHPARRGRGCPRAAGARLRRRRSRSERTRTDSSWHAQVRT